MMASCSAASVLGRIGDPLVGVDGRAEVELGADVDLLDAGLGEEVADVGGVLPGEAPRGGLVVAAPLEDHVAVLDDVLRTFSWGAIMPWKPWPHTCLEPQYQPSQLSGWRTCRVKPPISSSRRALWPCGVWMVLLSPWPSPWTRIARGPYCLWIRAISLAMMSVASSQEMRTYLLLPRFCGFRSPFGIPVDALERVLDAVGGVGALLVGGHVGRRARLACPAPASRRCARASRGGSSRRRTSSRSRTAGCARSCRP